MTDYNDGKWHGWNGGECPVDPQTHVDIVYKNNDGSCGRHHGYCAREWSWFHIDDFDIIAFRVVRPVKPADPLADLAARVEKLEAIINAIVPQRGPAVPYGHVGAAQEASE
jgi:hypothetical protein